MLKRKIDVYLKEWKESKKKALLVTGARQIGKTYSITHFIEENFKHYLIVNFAETPNLIEQFAKIRSADDLLIRILLIGGESMVEGETVIFLDEIQLVYQYREKLIKGTSKFAYQDILTAMKSLSIEGKYRFILSGSMLGVSINNVILYPLGYMDAVEMHPLDFEEYCWAKGIGNSMFSLIRKCFDEESAVDEFVNETFLSLFKEYVLIGGMPEAVTCYIESKNLASVEKIQKQIISKYLSDISSYIESSKEKLIIKSIYQAMPSELNSKNKRFMSSHVLEKGYLNYNDVTDDFLWLTNAGIAIPVYNVSEPLSPLVLASQRKTLKLFLNDIGLLISASLETGVREKLLNDEKSINFGAPYENAVAQELVAHGFGDSLFYFNSKKHGEIDFLVEWKGEVLPLEIKSGKVTPMLTYNHTALNNVMKAYGIKKAFVFGQGNVKKESDSIISLPIYMISFLQKSNQK